MSTIAERARAEADEAEAENPDEEQVEPIEPDEEEEETATPEPAPEAMTEKQLKERNKKLQAEDQRHETRLREIYGPTWGDRDMCPLCLQEGFVVKMSAEQIDPQQREAIAYVMGEADGPQLKVHPGLEMCTFCDGYGELLTGSKKEGALTEICPQCSRQGYVAKNAPAPPVNGQQAWTPPPPPAPAYDPANVNKDPWGRDQSNPYYGQDPALNGGVWS